MKSEINIASAHHDEFVSRFRIGDETYEAATEDRERKREIISRIYLKGEILSTLTSGYSHLSKLPNLREKLRTMMEKQHRSAIESFVNKYLSLRKTAAQYVEEIRDRLKVGDMRAARDVAGRGLENYPSDPFLLSYCGYLIAVVDRKPKEGTLMCDRAIGVLKRSTTVDSVFFLPLFYLHLGRAYLRGERKKAALKAFGSGLKYDHTDKDLLSEIESLGIRKRPVVPFLKRSHPLNKHLGRLRHKLRTAESQRIRRPG